MQAAVVMATFAYQAAMRDELLPRKPLPPVAAPPRPAPLPPWQAGAGRASRPAEGRSRAEERGVGQELV